MVDAEPDQHQRGDGDNGRDLQHDRQRPHGPLSRLMQGHGQSQPCADDPGDQKCGQGHAEGDQSRGGQTRSRLNQRDRDIAGRRQEIDRQVQQTAGRFPDQQQDQGQADGRGEVQQALHDAACADVVRLAAMLAASASATASTVWR